MFKYPKKENVLVIDVFGNTKEAIVTDHYFNAYDKSALYILEDIDTAGIYYREEPEIRKKPVTVKPITSNILDSMFDRLQVSPSTLVEDRIEVALVHIHKDEPCFVTKPITVNKHEAFKMMLALQKAIDALDEKEKASKT